jgi:ATP phosphoribosyltransferase
MSPVRDHKEIRLALPKGRMADGVLSLLADAGVNVWLGARQYRPEVLLPGWNRRGADDDAHRNAGSAPASEVLLRFECKILKPQAIVKMLQVGSRDLGFTGADWVTEFDADLVELLDTGLDPVCVVAAAPKDSLVGGRLPAGPLVVASELERITNQWIARRELRATFLRSFGATEVYPPEDADCIVDVVATGATLKANGLAVVDELMTSTTRLYANPAVLDDAQRRARIEDFVMLLQSVLEARRRVMVEVNVSGDRLEAMVAILPCMREPTIAPLHGEHGYAVKVAVPRDALPGLIPRVKALGGTDIVVSEPSQIVA